MAKHLVRMSHRQAMVVSLLLTLLCVAVARIFPDRWAAIEAILWPVDPVSQREDVVVVKRVVDGDTVELFNGEKVRLIGVDAPESVKPNSPVECFGREAARWLRETLEGKLVRLERDVSERDRYSRLLRYVYLDTVFINELLVREGYATAVSYPPDVRELERLRRAEHEARARGVGLWNEALCPPS